MKTADHYIQSLNFVEHTHKYKYCEPAVVECFKQVLTYCPAGEHDNDREEDNSFDYRKDGGLTKFF